jgi:hypothetical protein
MKLADRTIKLGEWCDGETTRPYVLTGTLALTLDKYIHTSTRTVLAVRDDNKKHVLYRSDPMAPSVNTNVVGSLTTALSGDLRVSKWARDPVTQQWQSKVHVTEFKERPTVVLVPAPSMLLNLLKVMPLDSETVDLGTRISWKDIQDYIEAKVRFHGGGKPLAPGETADLREKYNKYDRSLNHLSYATNWVLNNHVNWLGNLNHLRSKYDLAPLTGWTTKDNIELDTIKDLTTLATA